MKKLIKIIKIMMFGEGRYKILPIPLFGGKRK